MAEARIHLDVDAELAALAVELAGLANTGAELLSEEIRAIIPISDIPAEPGKPPHSRGPLRDSWKHSAAKRRRRHDSVVAYAYSMASTEDGSESLNEILDEGRGPVHPHPFLRAAVERARIRFDAVLYQTQSQLVAAARASEVR